MRIVRFWVLAGTAAMTIDASKVESTSRKLGLGMIGGGRGAFIGGVHRMASRLDGRYELVAGALSSDAQRSAESAADLGIAQDRSYTSYQQMVERERDREDRMHVVSIVTPNDVHFDACRTALEAGFHVICDKPMTCTVAEAVELAEITRRSGKEFILTQNYTAYPMVRQARRMVRDGLLGSVRLIQTSYAQDWLTLPVEDQGQKQAAWRTDPGQAGAAGTLGDIGVHAYNLAAFISELELESVCADLQSYGSGRRVDDNANVLLRYAGGATGTLWASQVAPGHNNDLCVQVFGDKGSLKWRVEDGDNLHFSPLGEPPRLITRGGPGADESAAAATRLPAGHPEGFIEAFANLYSEAADLIWANIDGRVLDTTSRNVPTVEDGARGMKFIEACVESSRAGGVWKDATLSL